MKVLENTQLEFAHGGLAAASFGGDDYREFCDSGDGGGFSLDCLNRIIDNIIGDFNIKSTSNMCTPTYTIFPEIVITAEKPNPIGETKSEALVSCFQNLTMTPGKATSTCAETIRTLSN